MLAVGAAANYKRRFKPEQFKLMLGASGGPKWFVLFGLDRYLFGNFFSNRKNRSIRLVPGRCLEDVLSCS